jgi:hypothetical protein
MNDPEQNVSLVTPSLLLTEQISQLLDEAVEKTGKTQEEILHCCLEHGIHKILKGTETGTSHSEGNRGEKRNG